MPSVNKDSVISFCMMFIPFSYATVLPMMSAAMLNTSGENGKKKILNFIITLSVAAVAKPNFHNLFQRTKISDN